LRASTTKIHAALFAVAILFSANYIISKFGMNTFAPLTFAWLRVLGSALILQAILPREREPFAEGDTKKLTILSLLGVVINQSLFLGGLSLTSAHVAAILITTIPVFTLATAIALGRERATVAKVSGIAIAGAGALLVIGVEGIEGTTRTFLGALMIVTNCLSYAIYIVVSKGAMTRLSPRIVLAKMFTIGTVLMLPVCAWSLVHQEWSGIGTGAWISLLLVILGPTVGAYLLNGWALARGAESSLVAAYTYLQPVMTTVLAAIFLDEVMHPTTGVAAVLIFLGVWIAGRRQG
jgi:drug/metabolite transporter (DMT)-like permease